jgi:hypothetical protein
MFSPQSLRLATADSFQPGQSRKRLQPFSFFSDIRKGQPSLRTYPLCSGADPSSDTALWPARQFRDLPCHPRFPGDSFRYLKYWPTPGPANSSEPAIIRLLSLITSGFQSYLRVFNFVTDANRINDLGGSRSVGWESPYRNGSLRYRHAASRSALFPVRTHPTAHLASESA